MDVSNLPFNKLIGLQLATTESGFQTYLPNDKQYTNHLGTVHASALLAVAEAGSGVFLAQMFSEYSNLVPVVRKIEAKFRKPGAGQVSARCAVASDVCTNWVTELNKRGRLSAPIPVEVVDATGNIVLSATVEWFISNAPI